MDGSILFPAGVIHPMAESYGSGEHYVYIWTDNFGDVFYVGSGKEYRYKSVNDKARSAEFMEWFNNSECVPQVVAYDMSKDESLEFERQLIEAYTELGFQLVNKVWVPEHEDEYRHRAEQKKRELGIAQYRNFVRR
jgi:hypothetical protein